MKKNIVHFATALSLVVLMSACSGDGATQDSPSNDAPAADSASADTQAANGPVFTNIKYTLLDAYPADAGDIDLSQVPGENPVIVTEGTWSRGEESSPPSSEELEALFDNDYSKGSPAKGGFAGAHFRWDGQSNLDLVGFVAYPLPDWSLPGFYGYIGDDATGIFSSGEFFFNSEVEQSDYEQPILVTFDPVSTSRIQFAEGVQDSPTTAHRENVGLSEFRLIYDMGPGPIETCDVTAWQPALEYNTGAQASNNGITFESKTYHLSCGDCGGPGFEQQWSVVGPCGTVICEVYPEWNAHDLFGPIDMIVRHQNKLYQAKQNEQIGLEPGGEGLEWAWEDLALKGITCPAP